MFSTEPSSRWFPDFPTILSRVFAFCAILVLGIAAETKEYIWGTIGVLFFGLLSQLLHRRKAATTQTPVDNFANEILNQVKEGNRPRFDLYLRPFSITKHVPMPNDDYDTDLLSLHRYEQPPTLDFETTLAGATPAPLIALGVPGEAAGAGRIKTDEDSWWGIFSLLADAAEQIFVVPSAKSGTRREIDSLKSRGQLGKCVFLSLPIGGRRIHIDRGPEWEATSKDLPIQLPPYASSGLFFRVDDAGKLLTTAQLHGSDTVAVYRAIKSLEEITVDEATIVHAQADERALSFLRGYQVQTRPKWRLVKALLWGLGVTSLLSLLSRIHIL